MPAIVPCPRPAALRFAACAALQQAAAAIVLALALLPLAGCTEPEGTPGGRFVTRPTPFVCPSQEWWLPETIDPIGGEDLAAFLATRLPDPETVQPDAGPLAVLEAATRRRVVRVPRPEGGQLDPNEVTYRGLYGGRLAPTVEEVLADHMARMRERGFGSLPVPPTHQEGVPGKPFRLVEAAFVTPQYVVLLLVPFPDEQAQELVKSNTR